MRLPLIILAVVLAAPAWAGQPERIGTPPPGAPGDKPSKMLRGIPDVIQANSWSCGPGAVQAVLTYYGIWGYQDDYATELGTTEEQGTHPARMTAYFRKWALDAAMVEGMTVRDLRQHVDRGVPVIVDFQAWNGKRGIDYAKEWEDGHYCIVVGYDRRGLYFEDPSLLGTLGYLRDAEFARRWHDYEIEDGKRRPYVRMGIVVKGKRRLQPPVTAID